jgi:PAS domain S-box-containing protein
MPRITDIIERTEEAPYEGEKRYQKLTKFSPVGIFRLDANGRCIYVNDRMSEITGLTPEQMSGLAWAKALHPDDHDRVLEEWKISQERKIPFYSEYRFQRPDGVTTWVIGQSFDEIGNDGKVIGFIGTVTDITERKQAEEKLRLFRDLIDRSNDAITVNYPETGHILDANNKACSSLGYTREELLNMRVLDFEVSLPDNFSWKEHVKEVEKKGYLILEGRNRRKDGTTFPVEANVTLLDLEKNKYMVAVVRDITDRKLAEEELKLRAQLLDNATDSIFVHDFEGNFIYVNEAAYESRGYTKEELLRIKLSDLDVPEDAKFIEHRINLLLEKGGAIFESTHYRKDCSMIPVEVHARVVEIKGKKLIISSARDITERKKAEELRRENERIMLANKAKSEFLATMSHELRTPLNSVIGFSELLLQNGQGELDEKQKHYVNNIHASGKHLLDLISDILDLTKVEAGKLDFSFEKLSVPEIINESLALVNEKASKHNVLLKKELDSQLGIIETDRLRFKQVLINLLSNAVKFSKLEGGTITIKTKKEGDMAKISVSDTGIGIKEEDMNKLFKTFEQIDSGLSRKYGGTGLGLAISKKLIELQGGKIWAESKTGEGSTFTFLLPIKARKVI